MWQIWTHNYITNALNLHSIGIVLTQIDTQDILNVSIFQDSVREWIGLTNLLLLFVDLIVLFASKILFFYTF